MKEIHYWQEGYDSSESRPDPLKAPERSRRVAEGSPDHRPARTWERAVGRMATRKKQQTGHEGIWINEVARGGGKMCTETWGVICWCHL